MTKRLTGLKWKPWAFLGVSIAGLLTWLTTAMLANTMTSASNNVLAVLSTISMVVFGFFLVEFVLALKQKTDKAIKLEQKKKR